MSYGPLLLSKRPHWAADVGQLSGHFHARVMAGIWFLSAEGRVAHQRLGPVQNFARPLIPALHRLLCTGPDAHLHLAAVPPAGYKTASQAAR